jgi:hypothetical protein
MGVNVQGSPLEFEAYIKSDSYEAHIRRLIAQTSQLTDAAQKEANVIDSIVKRTTSAIGLYASFAVGSNFVGEVARVRGEFQQLEVAFTTMLGSKEKADKLLAEVTEFAAKTPFELSEVAAATKQLLAFGISADKIKTTLKSLGDISAGIGAPIGEIAYLFGTIKTQGVALTQDVRQFATRGIPIYEELAKILGVAVEKVGDFITAGKVGFPEIEKVFQNLTANGSKFGGLMEAQAKTITGLQSNFRDAVDRMLNDIGKSQEGIIASAIKTATAFVENYEKVLDILKVLVITYGAYKAAIIAHNAVTAISTALTKGWTIAEILRFNAMRASAGAMRLLNATMLANPAVAVATGVALLVSALVVFGRTADSVKSKAELLADAQKNVGDKFEEQQVKIKAYVETLKAGNTTEDQRLNIYNKLKEINPEIVKGYDAKTNSVQILTANVNKYLEALRKQIALEANDEALQASIKQENALKKRIKGLNDAVKDLAANKGKFDKSDPYGLTQLLAPGQTKSAISQLEQQLKGQQKVTQELAQEGAATAAQGETTKQEAKKRTIAVIDEEISALKKQQKEESDTKEKRIAFDKKIAALEAERAKIVGESKREIAAANALESKTNALLEQRKNLLEKIAGLKRGSDQSGLIKEQSELDKINEKYDAAIQNVVDYNQKVAEFNKKNKTSVQGVGQVDINALNEARNRELQNTRLKDDADRYLKNLDNQKRIFEQFEEAKKQIGIEKANELFNEQTKNLQSYGEFLQNELAKITPKIVLGIANIGDLQRLKGLSDALKKFNEERAQEELKNISNLVSATLSYNSQRTLINERYNQLELQLDKAKGKGIIKNHEAVKEALKKGRADELEALENSLIRQSDLYKKLGTDIIGFSRERLKQQIKDLREQLRSGIFTDAEGKQQSLSPELIKAVEAEIERLNSLLQSTSEILGLSVTELNKIAADAAKLSGVFSTLAESVEPLNKNLSTTLSQIGQVVNLAGTAASGLASFASGDYIGAASAGASFVTQVINLFSSAKKSAAEAQRQIESFNAAVLRGEIEYGIALRNRLLLQAEGNKLTLEGLKAQKETLEISKRQNQEEFNRILQLLQQEQFIAGQSTKKKKNGFLNFIGAAGAIASLFGAGDTTQVQNQLGGLAGLTFEKLEELFAKGQLTDKAKELFQQLQKLKQEGVDIDEQLSDLRERAQEVFTGTTASNILDGIVDGFKNGLRSAKDFAGNFEELMRNALLNALKFRYLEGPINEIFEQFATFSEDGLTEAEVNQLREAYNAAITSAGEKLEDLQKIAGINISDASTQNSIAGQFKAMTEDTGNLLAGQFGGVRLTLIDVLKIATDQLKVQQNIEANTGRTVARLDTIIRKFDSYEGGTSSIKVAI